MTSAERQKRYRQRLRRLPVFEGEFFGLSRRDLVRSEARPRPPGGAGLAQAAAQEAVALTIEAREVVAHWQAKRGALWRAARIRIAQAIRDEGQFTDRLGQRADCLLRLAVEDELGAGAGEDFNLRPCDVWRTWRLSAHRAG